MAAKKAEEIVFWNNYISACRNGTGSNEPAKTLKSQIGKAILEINKAESLTVDDWKPLLTTLSKDESLHYIAISASSTRYKVLESLVGERDVRKSRKHPALYSKYLMGWLSTSISNTVSHSRSLTSLYLSKIPIKDEYVCKFAEGLSKTKSLQHLAFHHCPIEDDGCSALCKALSSRPTLTTLDLTDCALGPQAAFQIAQLIKRQCCARVSEVWKGSLRYGRPAGDDMPGLRRLTLNLNPNIGDKGIIELTSALYDDLWIKGVDMQGCGITREGGCSVARLLEENHCITVFDLRGNTDVIPVLPAIMSRLRYNVTCAKQGNFKCRWMEEVQPPSAKVSQMTLVKSSTSTVTLPSERSIRREWVPSQAPWLENKKSLQANNIRNLVKNRPKRDTGVSRAQSLDAGMQKLRFYNQDSNLPQSAQILGTTQNEKTEEEEETSTEVGENEDDVGNEEETVSSWTPPKRPIIGVSQENNNILHDFKKAILSRIRNTGSGISGGGVNITKQTTLHNRNHDENRGQGVGGGDIVFVDIPYSQNQTGNCHVHVNKDVMPSATSRIKKAEAGDASCMKAEKDMFKEKTHQLLKKLLRNRDYRGLEKSQALLKVCSQLSLPVSHAEPQDQDSIQPSASFSTLSPLKD